MKPRSVAKLAFAVWGGAKLADEDRAQGGGRRLVDLGRGDAGEWFVHGRASSSAKAPILLLSLGGIQPPEQERQVNRPAGFLRAAAGRGCLEAVARPHTVCKDVRN